MLITIALALAAQAAPSPFAFLDGTPIQVLGARMTAREAVLGRPLDGAVGADGRACVADASNGQITCLGPSGEILWQAGRLGGGPGEFDRLYRLAITPDNGVLAFDLSNSRLTRFDPRGVSVQTWQLPMFFRQVLSILFVGEHELLIAGAVGEAVATAGIHQFRFAGRTVRHVRSFGRLPAARNPQLIQFWGTGTLAAGLDGSYLYSPRLPYEITRFGPLGQELGVIRPPIQAPYSADDVLQVQESGERRSMSILDVPIPIPYRLHLLSPRLLLSHREVMHGGEVYWDFISLPGGETVSVRAPVESGVGQVFGVDRGRGLLWAMGTDPDGAPVVWRIEFRIRG